MKTRSHTSDNPKMAVKGYADGGKVPLPPTRPVAAASPKEEEKRKPKVTIEGGASGFSPSKGVDIVSGGGRVGVAIPVGKGTIDAGISGIGNSVRVKTPDGGTFKHNSGQFSGVDVGYTRGNTNFGASYSSMPDEQGKQDKRIMFTLNKSF